MDVDRPRLLSAAIRTIMVGARAAGGGACTSSTPTGPSTSSRRAPHDFVGTRGCQYKHDRVRGRRQVAETGGLGQRAEAVLAELELHAARSEYLVEIDELMHMEDDI